jgi:hypothetical protein
MNAFVEVKTMLTGLRLPCFDVVTLYKQHESSESFDVPGTTAVWHVEDHTDLVVAAYWHQVSLQPSEYHLSDYHTSTVYAP